MNSLPPRWKLRLILGLLFLVGIAFVSLLPTVLPWHWASRLSEEMGVAFVIAAILGLTVDLALKVELARDVFQAAFNYVLPDELKEEVRRVINYKFLCKKHYGVIEVNPVGGDLVRVVVSFERIIENITRNSEEFELFLDIDEWAFKDNPSGLEYYYAEISGKTFKAKRMEDGPGGKLIFRSERIAIPAHKQIKLIGKYYEMRRRNGEISLGWTTATVKPVVTVKLPKDFSHTCSFGIPGEQIEISNIDKRHELNGTQFPGQETKVRWWPTDSFSL